MKKEVIYQLVCPIICVLLGCYVTIYANEIKIKISTMNISPYIICFLIVLAGVSICYSFYLRLKSKIIALKTFYDKETIKSLNHSNANQHCSKLNFDQLFGKVYGNNQIFPLENPIAEKNAEENRRQQAIEIKEYNKAFEDWCDYKMGEGDFSGIYKESSY